MEKQKQTLVDLILPPPTPHLIFFDAVPSTTFYFTFAIFKEVPVTFTVDGSPAMGNLIVPHSFGEKFTYVPTGKYWNYIHPRLGRLNIKVYRIKKVNSELYLTWGNDGSLFYSELVPSSEERTQLFAYVYVKGQERLFTDNNTPEIIYLPHEDNFDLFKSVFEEEKFDTGFYSNPLLHIFPAGRIIIKTPHPHPQP